MASCILSMLCNAILFRTSADGKTSNEFSTYKNMECDTLNAFDSHDKDV